MASVANVQVETPQANSEPKKAERRIPSVDVAMAYHVNDAALVSGVSRSKLYELIAEQKLRSIKVAGRRLIPREALLALLNGEV